MRKELVRRVAAFSMLGAAVVATVATSQPMYGFFDEADADPVVLSSEQPMAIKKIRITGRTTGTFDPITRGFGVNLRVDPVDAQGQVRDGGPGVAATGADAGPGAHVLVTLRPENLQAGQDAGPQDDTTRALAAGEVAWINQGTNLPCEGGAPCEDTYVLTYTGVNLTTEDRLNVETKATLDFSYASEQATQDDTVTLEFIE